MDKFAEIGEEVIYTGDVSHATNSITVKLMKKHLVAKNCYRVLDRRWFFRDDFDHREVFHYRIKDFWAPCESFRQKAEYTKEYNKHKYNLK